MQQVLGQLRVRTHGPGLYEISSELIGWVADQGIGDGLLTVFIRHTSASLTIQENADPDVLRDLDAFFCRVVPRNEALYRHCAEGADDMPAHIRAALTATQISVPLASGVLSLGSWQGVYVFEHRDGSFSRNLALHLIGE